jgi:hypothetical protein
MGFSLMAGGAFRVSVAQLVSQLALSEREILKLCLSLGDLTAKTGEDMHRTLDRSPTRQATTAATTVTGPGAMEKGSFLLCGNAANLA